MKASVILSLAALVASPALAQTATQTAASSGSSSCAADYIVETCLGTENSILAACDTTDYGCQCAAYQAIVQCYDNCPNDQRKPTAQGQVTVYCGLASQYPSSTAVLMTASDSSVGAATTATATPAPTTAAAGTESTSTSGTATSSSASATGTGHPNGGAKAALSAGGVLAALAGVVAAVL